VPAAAGVTAGAVPAIADEPALRPGDADGARLPPGAAALGEAGGVAVGRRGVAPGAGARAGGVHRPLPPPLRPQRLSPRPPARGVGMRARLLLARRSVDPRSQHSAPLCASLPGLAVVATFAAVAVGKLLKIFCSHGNFQVFLCFLVQTVQTKFPRSSAECLPCAHCCAACTPSWGG